MAIVSRFTLKDVSAELQSYAKRAESVVLSNLQRLGEQVVIHVKDRPGSESWYDQTGNLRSSIGYVIGKDGAITHTGGFAPVLNGTDGVSEGKQYAKEIASTLSGKYFLIVVAGMNYASYVEDMENKDVLASATLLAEKELPKMIKRIEDMLNRAK